MGTPSFKVGITVPYKQLVFYVSILYLLCFNPRLVDCVVINNNVVYSSIGSPHLVTDDIIIKEGGRLVVQPGATLEFDAGVGITVHGVLDARGTPSEPITFTSRNPPEVDLHPPALRLIDGPSTTRGRLQIYYKDKWRSVCTNSKNWTRTDHHVTCRQLGFSGGYYYEWQDRPNNDTSTFLYELPDCQGHETDIGQCKGWYKHAIGGGVCDVHPDMGLACDEYHALWKGTNHWRGILFQYSEYSEQLVQENLLFLKVSKSILENVVIKYAGLGPKREAIPSLMATGVPPVMSRMSITQGLYTGINVTMPDTAVNMSHCVISRNAGIGIFVNSSTGLVSIGENTIVSDNMGDGVKYIQHHKEPDVRNSEQFQDFCSGASNQGQTYPLVTVAEQKRNSYHDPNCMRKFFTSDSNLVFTIHFTYIRVDQNDSATIEVRERDRNGELLTKFSLRNGTVAPSVVSYSNNVFVRFNAKPGRQVILYMQVLTQKYKIPDIVVNNSRIERNNGNGLTIDEMRSMVLVHKSNITDNIYGSGLSVRGGSGDVNVTYSLIANNIGDGINVTYEGGKQNVTYSNVGSNEGRGFAVWFNHTGRDTKIKQETGVAYSLFERNLDVGLRIGNFCREAFVNISTNYFNDGYKDAVEIESCWMKISGRRTVHIGHNSFNRNGRLAILASPAVHLNLTVEWNEFHSNKKGTVKIYNEDILEIERLPFIGRIYENTFLNNYGRYVMLLTLNIGSLDQSLFVSRNTIKRNVITEAYTSISSRSRASGVVCLGSFNIQLYRNLIENLDSLYELSSHALDQSSVINASYNWLGTKDEVELFDRVFDRRDRYTLALIEFHPFLLSDNNMDTPVISPPQYNEPDFFNPKDKRIIGGEVNGNVVLTKDFYEVVRDIYVQHTGILTIPFGTTLEFAQGIGMMVTGTLRTEGSGDKMVRFTLSGITEMEKIKALIEGGHIDELPDNMTASNGTVEDDGFFEDDNVSYSAAPVIPVKLIDGRNEMEGRLVVYSNGIWGTVCNHAWTIEAASVACQQMGHVLNPEDWIIESFDLHQFEGEMKILRSNVQCDEFDANFLECEHDSADDLVNSCSHNDDVGLICYPRTWAGVRLGMTAKESHIKGVIIEKAGLLDYTSRKFKPALQVDFNQHVLQELTLQDNSYDGLGIIRNNQYAISNPESRLLKKCVIRNNRRHGISFTQLGANITDSRIYDNSGSGIHFDPYLLRETQRELTGWLKLRQDDFVHIPDAILELGAENTAHRMGQVSSVVKINLVKDRNKGFITRNIKGQKEVEVVFTVTTSHTNVIGIQVLNTIERGSTENITVYDYHQVIESKDVAKWDFQHDMSVFPTTSSSYALTIRYKSGKDAWGDAMFVLTAVERRDIAQEKDLQLFRPKVPMVFLEDSKISRNAIGISTLHYNRYFTDDKDLLLRNSNETICVVRSQIVHNSKQAVYTLSPFRTKMDNDRIGEIMFSFNDSIIAYNGRGIEQLSWDIRQSNNLFHWIFENVTLKENGGSGVSLALPYVWQYNENFTHTVFVNNSFFTDNADFDFTIDGHFARVNISRTKFQRNVCSKAVLKVKGMEKEMFIDYNMFNENIAPFVVEFDADSQSEILGNVFAYFEFNTVQYNRNPPHSRSERKRFLTASSTVAVRGLQKLNITYNLLGDNEMDYELIAGVYTARPDSMLNVRANWWGSREVPFIKEKIFDFDDWNNFAIAQFQPFLVQGRFDASVANRIGDNQDYENDDTLGGRLTQDLLLRKRSRPYVVSSDFTVMPGFTLRIEPGVTIEFYPSVGLLVLGKMEAIGMQDDRIIMRPVDVEEAVEYRVGRQTFTERNLDVRLCIEGDCEGRRDGFLDIYNKTTKQWIPNCDPRFTERNAQVVCSQLGYNRVNIFYAMDKRTEMFPNALIRIRSWPEPIACKGDEKHLSKCPIRMNGQIFNHEYSCEWNEDFVYIHCGDLNLPGKNYEYWGGVRFSIPNFEFSNLYDRIHMTSSHAHAHTHHTHDKIANPSILAWVDIVGAGILHGEKSAAVLSFYETPMLLDVTVSHSAYDGASLVAAHEEFEMLHNRFSHNLGVGVSLVGLTGETRESDESSFTPVKELRLSYKMFGLVDICDSTKELVIEERVLLYYKYDNGPVDCVKIFSSAFDVKKFGFRLLQYNLFNSTLDPMKPDRIILYDGDIYNETTKVLHTLDAASTDSNKLFRTKGTRMSVQLHATGASWVHGFVAEIVTMPISTIGIDRDLLQNLTYNQFYDNQEGAVFAVTAGEVNPWLNIAWSRIENNGRFLYGNISTTVAAVKMDLQNMRTLYFKNNLVRNNTGGLNIAAGSLGAATKLWANITNNLFDQTIHRPSLYMESKEDSAYQQALIAYNDFSWSNSPYHDVITLAQIVSDFSFNYVHSNIGRHIFDVYGFEKVRLPVYQTTSHNSFAKNRAVDPRYPSTIIAGSAGQQYVDNVFYNLDNAYEMVAVNETVSGLRRRCNTTDECNGIAAFRDYDSFYGDVRRSDVWKTPIDARNNWWGFNTSVAVSGRVHDKLDDDTLLKVNYNEWKLNNFTLLKGCEPGYTLVGGSCYLYVGAPITHEEAKSFCRRDNASLPFLQREYHEVRVWIQRQQPEYQWDYDMVWVNHYSLVSGCAAFVDYKVREVHCGLNLPFICESEPSNPIDATAWVSDSLVIAAVGATLGLIIVVIAVLSCWGCKSRRRRKERLERRNSIRASIRSNRSVLSLASTSGGFSDSGHRRRIIEEPNHLTTLRTASEMGANGVQRNGLNGSFNSISKSAIDDSINGDPSYVYETTQTSAASFAPQHIDTRFANDPALENANVDAVLRPTFDVSYKNRGFRDTSTFSSNDTALTYAESREPSTHQQWGSNSNIVGARLV